MNNFGPAWKVMHGYALSYEEAEELVLEYYKIQRKLYHVLQFFSNRKIK
jgi:hypothetical protein